MLSNRHVKMLAQLLELKRRATHSQPEPRGAARSQPIRAEPEPARRALKPPMHLADLRELVLDLKALDEPQHRDVEPGIVSDADDVAAFVAKAARIRDRGGPVIVPPDKDSVAGQILEAGRKRRGGEA